MRLRSVLALLPLFSVLLSGCGGSGTTTVPTGNNSTNIVVTVTPTTTQNVDAGQTVALSAAVANDQGSKGVQWSVAAGAGALASVTGATNTYTAPAVAATGVVVTATSVADPTKAASITVNVFATPGFSTLSPLPMGYANIAYSTTLTAVGGIGAKAISLASGTVPPGLTLSSSGVLSGTPTTVGTYTFSAQVMDSAATPVATTATYSVSVLQLAINPLQLPGGVIGSTYGPATITSSGANGAVTYAVSSGALPAGLSLSSSGVLTGTPTTTGTSTFTVRATDAGDQTAVASYTVAVATKLVLANVTVPSGNVGTAMATYQFQATGGTTPYAYTLASGSTLPTGLSLTTSGVLYGTPTVAGDYSFNVTATDGGSATGGATPGKQTATAVVTLHVSAFALSGGTLTNATQNVAYTATLQPTGGTTPYTFAVTSGALPTGLALNPMTGVISGTPTGSGISSFSVTLTDADGRQVIAAYKLSVLVPVTFSTATALPGGSVNTAYTTTVQATGGTGPYTYAVSGGSALPAGLSLSTSGTITGTPSVAASNSFGLTATDAVGGTGSATFSLTVASPLTFANVTLPGATTTVPVASYTFAPSGGTAPYTFAVAMGSTLPAGLTLSASGLLSGAPTTGGSYSFGVTTTDSGSSTSGSSTPAQQTATATVTLVVTAYVITTTSIPNIVPQSAYTYMTTVTGGTAPYTYALAGGALPNGIALNTTTGRIEGTTTVAPGTYTFTEQVTDANNHVVTKMLSVNVSTTLSPGPNNSMLNGQYAFTFSGFTNGTAASTVYGTASVGVLSFDGTSTVTGTYDVNSAIAGFQTGQMISNGSYTLNADQRGTLVFTSNGVVTTMNINVAKMSGSAASQIGLLEFDDQDPTDPSQLIGGGVASLQTSANVNLVNRYVFSLKGETPSASAGTGQFGSETAAGYLHLDGNGSVSGGSEDVSTYGHTMQSTTITGSTVQTDTTLGRGTFTLAGLTGSAPNSNFVYYSVSPTLLYVMSTDAHNGNFDLLSGTMEQQTGTAFTNQSLSGTVIGYDSGSDGGDGQSAYQNATFADAYRMVFTPTTASTTDGTVTLTGVTNQNGTASTIPSSSGTYTVGTDGRVTILTPSLLTLGPIYLTDTNAGVGITVSPTASKGNGVLRLEAQTATALTDGIFGFRTQQTTTRSYGLQGTATIGNTGTTAAENSTSVLFDQPVNMRLLSQAGPNTTVTADSTTGALVVGSDPTNAYRGFVISGSKAATVLTLSVPYVPAVVFEK